MGRDSNLIEWDTNTIQCSICHDFPIDPIECKSCSNLFCKECLMVWFHTSQKFECPHKCSTISLCEIQGSLKLFYNRAKTRCQNRLCKFRGSVHAIIQHEETCLEYKTNKAEGVRQKIVEMIKKRRDAEWISYLMSVYQPAPIYYMYYY